MAILTFSAFCDSTCVGDSLLLAGELSEFGTWNSHEAIELDCENEWPYWHTTVQLNEHYSGPFEFKLAIRRASGDIVWCPNMFNHSFNLVGAIDADIQLRWGCSDLIIQQAVERSHSLEQSPEEEHADESHGSCLTPTPCPLTDNFHMQTHLDDHLTHHHKEPWYFVQSSSLDMSNAVDEIIDEERAFSNHLLPPVGRAASRSMHLSDYTTQLLSTASSMADLSQQTVTTNHPSRRDYTIIAGNPTHDFEYRHLVGDGMSGHVYKAFRKSDGKPVAIKEISKHNQFNSTEAIRRECCILQHLSADTNQVIELLAVYEDASDVYLVTEWGDDGDLFGLLQEINLDFMPEGYLKALFTRMLQCVSICHANGVCHRDIKPENFLVHYDYLPCNGHPSSNLYRDDIQLKLIDFGLADFCAADVPMLNGLVGTAYYVAPEVIDHDRTGDLYGRECDLWSIGCIMYLFMEGTPPFFSVDDDEVYDAIKHHSFPMQAARRTGNFGSYSRELKDLVTKLLKKNPKDRPSAAQALNHPWFTTCLSCSSDASTSETPSSWVTRSASEIETSVGVKSST